MAAAYSIGSTANKRSTWRLIKHATNYTNNVPFDPQGFFAFDTGAQALAATNVDDADDAKFTFQFPDNCYIYDLQATVTDLDGDAAPALVFDVITSTTGASGGTEVVLINDSDAGQAGGSDELDRNSGHMFRDVSGLYLGIRVVTPAATPAAGTIRFKGIIHVGSLITGL